MAFDKAYYESKKQKLIQKAQQIQQEYLGGAFKFTSELNDIQSELKTIEEWENEQPKETEEEPKPE